MSYMEHRDLFEWAQNEGRDEAPYRMLVIDVVDSKKLKYNPYKLNDFIAAVADELERDGLLYVPQGDERDTRVETCYRDAKWAVDGGDMRIVCMDEKKVRELIGVNDEGVLPYLQGVLDKVMESSTLNRRLHWATGVFHNFRWGMGSDTFVFPYCVCWLGNEVAKTNGLFC